MTLPVPNRNPIARRHRTRSVASRSFSVDAAGAFRAELQVTVHGYKAQGICAAADQDATETDPGTVILAAVDDSGERIGSGFAEPGGTIRVYLSGERIGSGFAEPGGTIRVYLSAYPPVALTLVPLQTEADEL